MKTRVEKKNASTEYYYQVKLSGIYKDRPAKINPEFIANHGYKFSSLAVIFTVLAFLCLISGSGCSSKPAADTKPVIQINAAPPAAEGGPERTSEIVGSVTNYRSGQQVVIYAKSGVWWIQPLADQPFTAVQPDGTWKNSTHFGTEYAALLVEPGYNPPAKTDELPAGSDKIIAITTIKGEVKTDLVQKIINFSGYQWKVRSAASERGGRSNDFDPANVWTDDKGFLHLRIKQNGDKWTCAEVNLTRSLGYGTYNFTVQDVSGLDPAAVFSMFTWDDPESNQNHREMNIEVSRWGDASSKNMQYVIQPYYVPANIARYAAPPGVLKYSFKWEPGRATFKTYRGSDSGNQSSISDHLFTSGIPLPESETVHLNLYVYWYGKSQIEKENEVVIEKFEFLP